MAVTLMGYAGTAVLSEWQVVVDAYRDIFTIAPWDETEDEVAAFGDRLLLDAHRDGFRAVLAWDGDRALGFGTAWLTPSEFPTGRGYAAVTRSLGRPRVQALLCGSLEVDELGISPTARGLGIGGQILSRLLESAAAGRCWLLTWTKAPGAVGFYRQGGWHEVPALPTSEEDVVVFLGPEHPDAREPGAAPSHQA